MIAKSRSFNLLAGTPAVLRLGLSLPLAGQDFLGVYHLTIDLSIPICASSPSTFINPLGKILLLRILEDFKNSAGSRFSGGGLLPLLFQLCLGNTGEPAGLAGVWITSFKAQYFGLLEFTYKSNILPRPGGQPHFLSLDVISLKKKMFKKKKKKSLFSLQPLAELTLVGSTAYRAGAEPAARPPGSRHICLCVKGGSGVGLWPMKTTFPSLESRPPTQKPIACLGAEFRSIPRCCSQRAMAAPEKQAEATEE